MSLNEDETQRPCVWGLGEKVEAYFYDIRHSVDKSYLLIISSPAKGKVLWQRVVKNAGIAPVSTD